MQLVWNYFPINLYVNPILAGLLNLGVWPLYLMQLPIQWIWNLTPDVLIGLTLSVPVLSAVFISVFGTLGILFLILSMISGVALTFLFGVPLTGLLIVGGVLAALFSAFTSNALLVTLFGVGGVGLAWVSNIALLVLTVLGIGFLVFGVVGSFQFITMSGWGIIWLIGLVFSIPALLSLGIFGYFYLSNQLSMVIMALF